MQRKRSEAEKPSNGTPPAGRARAEGKGEEIKPVDQLIREGHHPVHAFYTNVNNLISLFTEEVICLPMFDRAHSFLEKAQDMYCPGYPPMSPITVSYYLCWTLYDVPFGKDKETMGVVFWLCPICSSWIRSKSRWPAIFASHAWGFTRC